jgi:hypothetical protein
MIIIKPVPEKAVSTLLGIVETASVKRSGSFRNNPETVFVEYQSGRDALAALDSISVWVDDKWPVLWGPRPTVRTNLGRVAKPAITFGAGQAHETCVLTRPAPEACRAWGAAGSWREHDMDLGVTVG